jgi:hypothetical protein
MGLTEWIVDKSALARLGTTAEGEVWAERIERGLVRIRTVTRPEVGWSARSGRGLRSAAARPPLSSMPVEYLTRAVEDRAVQVQMLLADRGLHRAPSVPDLMIAATAELAGLTVLHMDKAFDLIAGITGQPVQRLQAASTGDDDPESDEQSDRTAGAPAADSDDQSP